MSPATTVCSRTLPGTTVAVASGAGVGATVLVATGVSVTAAVGAGAWVGWAVVASVGGCPVAGLVPAGAGLISSVVRNSGSGKPKLVPSPTTVVRVFWETASMVCTPTPAIRYITTKENTVIITAAPRPRRAFHSSAVRRCAAGLGCRVERAGRCLIGLYGCAGRAVYCANVIVPRTLS